jgi:hypothetical protein
VLGIAVLEIAASAADSDPCVSTAARRSSSVRADNRPAGSLPPPHGRATGDAWTCAAETLSGSLGLHPAGEAEGAAPSLLSTDALNSADAQMLALPDLGRLRLADTVYLTREGPKTVGLLFARDVSARTCLLTLDMRPTDGSVAWRATVQRVTREGVHSSDGVGASFLFYPRERTIE